MRLMRLPAVLEMTGLTRTRLYEQVNAGTFPRPAKLGPQSRAIAWPNTEIEGWIADRLADREAA